MLQSIICEKNGKLSTIKINELDSALKKCEFVWIDIEKPTYKDFSQLSKRFNLHKLAVENAVVRNQRPKYQSFFEYLLLVMHDIKYNKGLHLDELDLFLGKNFVISVHYKKIDAINYAVELYRKEPWLFKRGADFLIYNILDGLVDDYLTILGKMDDKLDVIEDKIFTKPEPKVINELFNMKKNILKLYKTIGPQAEIINALMRREAHLVKPETAIYFRDIYDRIIRILSIIETQREIATGALEAYLLVVSNKMNEIMKVLTIIATVVLPLTLIAGIYGMNFKFMPELEWQHGYFITLGVMLIVACIMLLFFRKKGWI